MKRRLSHNEEETVSSEKQASIQTIQTSYAINKEFQALLKNDWLGPRVKQLLKIHHNVRVREEELRLIKVGFNAMMAYGERLARYCSTNIPLLRTILNAMAICIPIIFRLFDLPSDQVQAIDKETERLLRDAAEEMKKIEDLKYDEKSEEYLLTRYYLQTVSNARRKIAIHYQKKMTKTEEKENDDI